MTAVRRKRVLVVPLDWGLGHAARCVPVVRALRRAGAEVLLAAAGRSGAFLAQALPDVPLLPLPGYDVRLPRGGPLIPQLLVQAPRIALRMRRERAAVARLVREQAIDVVISDNRPGCRSEDAHNVYVTHQLRIQAPGLAAVATRVHRRFMRRFDEVWVPDLPGDENLSGDLGHDPAFVCDALHYVGPLSRFPAHPAPAVDTGMEPAAGEPFRLLVLLSGPEPQRTAFEEAVVAALRASPVDALVVRGRPELPSDTVARPGLRLVHHLSDRALQDALLRATAVLARPGYSTLCDVSVFGKPLLLVPTPGQTEQEYLARRLAAQGCAVVQRQSALALDAGFRALAATRPLRRDAAAAERLLHARVRTLLA